VVIIGASNFLSFVLVSLIIYLLVRNHFLSTYDSDTDQHTKSTDTSNEKISKLYLEMFLFFSDKLNSNNFKIADLNENAKTNLNTIKINKMVKPPPRGPTDPG
jgi:hypothetical protein